MAATRGLYHSYTITSQSYSTRSITNGINAFNKPDAAAEPDTAAEPAAEPADATTVAECYTGSTAFFYITNHRQQSFYGGRSYTKYKTFSAFFTERSIRFYSILQNAHRSLPSTLKYA